MNVTAADFGLDAGLGGNYYPDWDAGVGNLDRVSLYDEVFKALTATGGLPRSGPGINAAEVEDLSATLASSEIKERSLHFWKRVPKKPARSLNAEWVRIDDYGDNGESGFIAATDGGFVGDPTFFRGDKLIKYLAVKGQVDLPTQLVELVGFGGRGVNAMNTNQTARMRHLLRLVERQLFHANSAIDSLEFDGAFSQIDAVADESNGLRYNMQGQPLDRYALSHMSQIAADNNADLTDFYLPNEAFLDLNLSLYPTQRSNLTEAVPDASIGINFERILIQMLGGDPGYCRIRRTQMLTSGVKGALPSKVPTKVGQNAPVAPVSVSGVDVPSIVTSQSIPGLQGQTYYYSATAVGKGGRSAATAGTAGVAVSTGDAVSLTMTSNDPSTRYYEIYRNPAGVTSSLQSAQYYMCRVPALNAAGNFLPSVTWRDDGYFSPNTMHMGCFSFEDDEIYVKQLLPPVKRMLPQDLMANAFGILLFIALILEVASHNIHVVNIGKRFMAGSRQSGTVEPAPAGA